MTESEIALFAVGSVVGALICAAVVILANRK
jgi:hypothetical protein